MDNYQAKVAEIRRLSEKFMPAMQTMAWTPNDVITAIVTDLYTSPFNDYPNHEDDSALWDLTTKILGNEQRWEGDAA